MNTPSSEEKLTEQTAKPAHETVAADKPGKKARVAAQRPHVAAAKAKQTIPTGLPRNPKYGILKSGCSATVIPYMAEFIATISSGDPPW